MAIVPSPLAVPPIRACIFDVDGLLINSEDLLSTAINSILAEYSRPSLPWSVKAQLQGRPLPESAKLVIDWAQIPISVEEFRKKLLVLQLELFKTTKPLPGVPELLRNLARAKTKAQEPEKGSKLELALATSSQKTLYEVKTNHLDALFDLIPDEHKILGDDPRLLPGRGKPLPDIYLLALACINKSLGDEYHVKPEECLVFEDSVAGVEAGRRAGMRVVWVPHASLRELYHGREGSVLMGTTRVHSGAVECDDRQTGGLVDGMGNVLTSLEDFEYAKYGISVKL